MGIMAGPMPPMTRDQNRAGFSREAQRMYLKGVTQKWGAAADMVLLSRLADARGCMGEQLKGRTRLCGC